MASYSMESRILLSELILTDKRLRPIADKVLAGQRLTFEDGIDLYRFDNA